MKTKQYIARGACGLVVAACVADTPADQAHFAGDVKRWLKEGFSVELEERGPEDAVPKWCDENCGEHAGKCGKRRK